LAAAHGPRPARALCDPGLASTVAGLSVSLATTATPTPEAVWQAQLRPAAAAGGVLAVRERGFEGTQRCVVDLENNEPALMTMTAPVQWPPTRDPLPWDERGREMKTVFVPREVL
jgi:hypothetical protein